MRKQNFLLFRVYRFRDTGAYAQLYDIHFARIRRYIYFKVPREEDADELTAEVFLRAWEYATSSRIEHPGALFYRIAKNVIADFYRSRKITTNLSDMTQEPEVQESRSIERRLDTDAATEKLMKTLRQLKEEYQDIIIMRYLDEMSVKEIAAALEKTPNNIRVLLYRAKNALKKSHGQLDQTIKDA